VGTGKGGRAVLEALLRVPAVEVRYVFDAKPNSPLAALARKSGVSCRTDGRFDELAADPRVDLILETTGDPKVLRSLQASKHPNSCVLAAPGRRLVGYLLAAERHATAEAKERSLECDRLREQLRLSSQEHIRHLRQATHQLKSPLASIQSYVNVILGGYTGEVPEPTRAIIEKIRSRCDAALRALSKRSLLARLSGMEHGTVEAVPIHLNDIIGQAVDAQAKLAAERGITIDFQPVAGADLVRGEPGQVLTLVAELLENAVIYSRDQGSVEVSVQQRLPDALDVSVCDHGIGIPQRSLSRIFDEDYRADPAVKHYRDGAGLGLAIARTIAALQGVRLRVESEEGQGSIFTASFPQARDA
jgi:signal transduction histidine kinase